MKKRHLGKKRETRTSKPLDIRRYQKLILFHSRDNVGVAIQDIEKGEALTVMGRQIEALNPVRRGHKIAIKDIPNGAKVIKLGVVIGEAKRKIKAGEHVHIHNLRSLYA